MMNYIYIYKSPEHAHVCVRDTVIDLCPIEDVIEHCDTWAINQNSVVIHYPIQTPYTILLLTDFVFKYSNQFGVPIERILSENPAVIEQLKTRLDMPYIQ